MKTFNQERKLAIRKGKLQLGKKVYNQKRKLAIIKENLQLKKKT